MILAIVDDMLFRSKLEAVAAQLGTPLTLAEDASPALRSGSGWSRAIIDLNLSHGDPRPPGGPSRPAGHRLLLARPARSAAARARGRLHGGAAPLGVRPAAAGAAASLMLRCR